LALNTINAKVSYLTHRLREQLMVSYSQTIVPYCKMAARRRSQLTQYY